MYQQAGWEGFANHGSYAILVRGLPSEEWSAVAVEEIIGLVSLLFD